MLLVVKNAENLPLGTLDNTNLLSFIEVKLKESSEVYTKNSKHLKYFTNKVEGLNPYYADKCPDDFGIITGNSFKITFNVNI